MFQEIIITYLSVLKNKSRINIVGCSSLGGRQQNKIKS